MTRNYWRIPFYGMECNHNKDEQCYDRIHPTSVHLASLNISLRNSLPDHLRLFEADEIVIPDTSFIILLNHPFKDPVEIPIQLTTVPSLRFLLSLLHDVYQGIYAIERETATSSVYTYVVECTDCDSEYTQQIQEFKEEAFVGDCSVCYNPYEQSVKLPCSHIFHKSCLVNWMEKGSSRTCPLCRTVFMKCTKCDDQNTRVVERRFVEVPREVNFIRNQTDGVFGIHTCRFEDLWVDSLWYNKITKTLQVFIYSEWEGVVEAV